MFGLQLFGAGLVPGLGRREIPKQFTGIGIGGALCRLEVKGTSVALHRLGFVADTLYSKVFDQPDRAAGIESGDMFAPNQRDHLAKAAAMQLDQTVTVAVFFGCHPIKDRGGIRKILAQHFGIRAIDACVILFRGNSKRENLLLAQIAEATAGCHAGNHRAPLLELF